MPEATMRALAGKLESEVRATTEGAVEVGWRDRAGSNRRPGMNGHPLATA